MASLIPISTYNLAIDPFMPVAAIEEEYPITIRITLAALDPEAVDDKEEPSTLRLLKRSSPFLSDEDEDSEEEIDDDEEEEEEEEEEEKQEEKQESEDDLDSEEETKPEAKKSKKSKKFTKKDDDKESEEDSEGSDEELDDEDDVSEFVICTLSPKTCFQQPIDITISPDEEVYFVVTGSYPIHLSGNYVEHPGDEDSDEEDDVDDYIYGDSDEYDLTPDEDELIDIEDLEDEADIEGKIQELVDEDDNKKRTIEQDENPKKKSKKEDKKSVQFSKELEQGPTGSDLVDKKKEKKEKAKAKKEDAKSKKDQKDSEEPKEKKFVTKTLLGGVITEDRKTGKGAQAKGGNKVGIRYIGKLKNGKVFDKNTSGKPFTFNLGKGECIKGFDLGVAGMAVGGERRVIIPPKMGYGSQALPGIPANSELTFDIKLVSLK
jgi:FK506-binding nuclear protein